MSTCVDVDDGGCVLVGVHNGGSVAAAGGRSWRLEPVSCEPTSMGVIAHADITISPKPIIPVKFNNEGPVYFVLQCNIISISPN